MRFFSDGGSDVYLNIEEFSKGKSSYNIILRCDKKTSIGVYEPGPPLTSKIKASYRNQFYSISSTASLIPSQERAVVEEF